MPKVKILLFWDKKHFSNIISTSAGRPSKVQSTKSKLASS
jgi:hypothetical protein